MSGLSTVAQRSTSAEADPFETEVSPMVPLLLRYFARRVRPTDDAADCTSETLLVLWKKRDRWPVAADEQRAWSYGVARKVLANHQRGKVRLAKRDESLREALRVPVPPVPDEAHLASEALARLPMKDQELVILVVWDELSVADAGRSLGISPGAARTRYSRALGRLRLEWARFE